VLHGTLGYQITCAGLTSPNGEVEIHQSWAVPTEKDTVAFLPLTGTELITFEIGGSKCPAPLRGPRPPLDSPRDRHVPDRN
jgi:hypothetical protein